MERNEINNEQLNNLERNQALRKLVLEIYAKIQALIKNRQVLNMLNRHLRKHISYGAYQVLCPRKIGSFGKIHG
jgi:regulator of replication initiation timing